MKVLYIYIDLIPNEIEKNNKLHDDLNEIIKEPNDLDKPHFNKQKNLDKQNTGS